ncbi:MAG: hypothetical protein JNL62_10830 [Bryobacterales bacterium]|nr:hypothetical protein [Bryobacterales bacterium]
MTEAMMEMDIAQDESIRNVLGARFRANAEFELVAFEQLGKAQQEQWKELANDPSFYGLLLPREGTPWRAKSACRDTALLFFTLQSAGCLPGFALRGGRQEANRAVAQLVLDGILEMACEGVFVTGPAAAQWIVRQKDRGAPQSPLARLSSEALAYGASMVSLDAGRLSARMYFYNRLPLTAYWRERFTDVEKVKGELGAIRGWQELPAGQGNNGWISWRRVAAPALSSGVRMYKLYFSPRPEALRESFGEFVAAIARCGCSNFKAGRNAAGLLRPDKAVAYFGSQEQVLEAAERTGAALQGCPAQGVPFSAPVDDSLLVSWGVDPAADEWELPESWRLWVTNRLAVHLKAAAAAGEEDVGRFALDRMRLEQVNTDTWAAL